MSDGDFDDFVERFGGPIDWVEWYKNMIKIRDRVFVRVCPLESKKECSEWIGGDVCTGDCPDEVSHECD
jgi:hypothetical protein